MGCFLRFIQMLCATNRPNFCVFSRFDEVHFCSDTFLSQSVTTREVHSLVFAQWALYLKYAAWKSNAQLDSLHIQRLSGLLVTFDGQAFVSSGEPKITISVKERHRCIYRWSSTMWRKHTQWSFKRQSKNTLSLNHLSLNRSSRSS